MQKPKVTSRKVSAKKMRQFRVSAGISMAKVSKKRKSKSRMARPRVSSVSKPKRVRLYSKPFMRIHEQQIVGQAEDALPDTFFSDAHDRKELQELLLKGKDKGFVTFQEMNESLPDDMVSSDQLDDLVSFLGDSDIDVVDDHRRAQDQRSGAHVPEEDGLGLAAHPRGRGGDRQAHRGGRERGHAGGDRVAAGHARDPGPGRQAAPGQAPHPGRAAGL
jgi:hypothetical protein